MFVRALIFPMLAGVAGLLAAHAGTLSLALIQTSGDPAIGTDGLGAAFAASGTAYDRYEAAATAY